MAESKKTTVALNPNAPEFYPKPPVLHEISQLFLQKPKCFNPPKTMFGFNNQFPYQPYQNYQLQIFKQAKKFPVKPMQPYRFRLQNRKLPPRLLNKKVYVRKNRSLSPVKLVDKSSVMIRNIPNSFGRSDLLGILDRHCWKVNNEAGEQQTRSSYDFLYLPMDFVKHANLGYAFVNFTSSLAAEKFRREFDNFFWTTPGNKKYCQITVAKFQGKEELSRRFEESRFPCHTDDYLPVVLSPPSDGFAGYSLTTLGYRAGTRGGDLGRNRVA